MQVHFLDNIVRYCQDKIEDEVFLIPKFVTFHDQFYLPRLYAQKACILAE